MSPADEVEVVFVQKFGYNLCPEREGDAPVVLAPAHCVLVEKKKKYIF